MVDTRKKIISLDEACGQVAAARSKGVRVRAVTGYFDPLLPIHIAHLAKLAGGGRLYVIVASPEDAYLELRARAELAAALDFVECVVTGAVADAEALGADEVLLEHQTEGERRQEFIRYVKERAGS